MNAKATTTELFHNSELHFVRNKLENFQKIILKDVEKCMSGMIDEVMQEIRQHELQSNEFRDFAKNSNNNNNNINLMHKNKYDKSQNTWNNRIEQTISDDSNLTETDVQAKSKRDDKAQSKRRPLPDKVFITRESYLTALLEVAHMKTIYHIFTIILIVLLMNSICHDYFVEGRVSFGLGTFKLGFHRIHYVLGFLFLEHIFVFTLYYAFKGWAAVYVKLHDQKSLQNFWSHSCLILHICGQLVFVYSGSYLCLKWDLPFVSASVLLLETVRLLMKMHGFVRVNGGRVLMKKLKNDNNENTSNILQMRISSFKTYVYYLFAPTLIYRDSYPRTTQIRWKFALARFLEVVAIAFIYSYLHERHIKVHFGDYGKENVTAPEIIVKLFGMLMPSIIIFLCGFYLILHSWLNFTAELLRFGDRMFYKDWWTSHTYDGYYRNWNVVVHDWLYEYIYKDFYNHIFKGSKGAASLMVFTVSAIVHEHIIGFAFQMFFPVMFTFFGIIGVALVYITRKAPKNLGNIFLWFSLIFGNGMMFSLYCMEYYARYNCTRVYEKWTDYLYPAIWSC